MNSELWSHPEKPLISHLIEVANLAIDYIKGKRFNFNLNFQDTAIPIAEWLTDLVYLSSAFHDLGKATPFFQSYIRNPELPHDKKKSHALLSAVFVFFVVEKYLHAKPLKSKITRICSVFAFSAVKRHHGRLENLSEEILIEKEWRKLLPELAKSVNKHEVQNMIDYLLKDLNISANWNEFLQFIDDEAYDEIFEDFSFDLLQKEINTIDKSLRMSLYYFHHIIYSSLLYADKNEVIISVKEKYIPANIEEKVHAYRHNNSFDAPLSEIDQKKNESFLSSLNNLERVFRIDHHIYSLTLPTGLGKTITAYMLADKIRKITGFDHSRIIINIPFTSIIDQNFEVYARILQTNDSDMLLKHHHLSEPVYKSGENVLDYPKSKFLIETWQSDTIVTTFVQLLETILSCDKAKLMKFGSMANSIVLLDEIQTIPYTLWETIREVFKVLGKNLNIYFLLISATQPLIFDPSTEIVEIIPDHKKYFRIFNRTRLIISGSVTFETFLQNLLEYIRQYPCKDVMCILNTKKAALETFKNISGKLDAENTQVYFLTTLITPYERKDIINKIKTPTQKQKIIISTQLVEAGVDISVDAVFRQIAPLDSIIQAAGRANRYNEKQEISDVFIIDIEDYRKATNMVYGSDLIIKTNLVLKNYNIIEEKDYLDIIEKYFLEVRKQADNTSQDLLKAIQNLDFGKVDFELIEYRQTESVFVQLNERAKEIWEKYAEINSNISLKPWERDELFCKIKAEFYDFVINVPVAKHSRNIVFDSEKIFDFYVSQLDYPSRNYTYNKENYATNTGYTGESNTIQFL